MMRTAGFPAVFLLRTAAICESLGRNAPFALTPKPQSRAQESSKVTAETNVAGK
jgi:hypothetical protein